MCPVGGRDKAVRTAAQARQRFREEEGVECHPESRTGWGGRGYPMKGSCVGSVKTGWTIVPGAPREVGLWVEAKMDNCQSPSCGVTNIPELG